MEQKQNHCCQEIKPIPHKGFASGILYGLIPHSFCIAFVLFSIIGGVAATAFLKKFLLIPNLFYFLVIVSLFMATLSAGIYLRRNQCLCASGIKSKWQYISTLYTATILVNLLMFFVIIPTLVNLTPENASAKGNSQIRETTESENNLSDLSISVQIPCSGHAALIMDEIRKNCEIQSIKFEMPNNFEIRYDPQKTSPEKIISLGIFKTYTATIN